MANKNEVEKILDIRVRYNDAIKNISEYKVALEGLKNEETLLNARWKEGLVDSKEYYEQLAALKAQSNQYSNNVRVLTKEIQNNIKYENEQSGSLVALRARLSNLTTAYDALSKADRESEVGKNLSKQINEVTKELKNGEEETGRFYRSVGSYTDSITKAAQANLPFVDGIKQSAQYMSSFGKYILDVKSELSSIITGYNKGAEAAQAFSGAQKSAAIASNTWSAALKVLKLALISTGIGVIVVALGTLISYLTRTQKGTEMLSKAMAAVGAVIDVIIDRAAKLGSALIKVFSGDFVGADKDAKDALSGIGDEMEREINLSMILKDKQNQLEKQEVMLSMRRAASRSEIEKLKLIADDTTKSLNERIAAAEKAYKMEEELAQESVRIGKERLATMLGQEELTEEVNGYLQKVAEGALTADEVISNLGLSESTVGDLKEFAQVFNDVAQKEAESYTRNKETQNKTNTMRKEAADKVKEAKHKEVEAVRQAEDAMLALVTDELEKQRQQVNLSYDRQIQDLKTKLAEEKNLTAKGREAINQTIISLEQQRQDELNKISDAEIQKLIKQEQARITLKLETIKKGSEEEFNLRIQLLESQREAELENTKLTEEERLLVIAKYNKQKEDLTKKFNEDSKKEAADAIKAEFEERIMVAGKNEEEILRIKVEQRKMELDALQQMEGESDAAFKLRQLEAERNYVEAKQNYADKEIEIEQRKASALAQIGDSIISVLENIGEGNRQAAIAAKIIGIATVAINQGIAISEAVKNATSSSAGIFDMIAKIAAAVTTVVVTMASAIKSIKSAKFAEGGVFSGDGYVSGAGSGTSDSINAHLSNGESVLTAKATSMFAPLLSAFNQAGGGVPITVTENSSTIQGEDMLARAFIKGVASMPNPVVSVAEINTVNNRVNVLENLGRL
nr:MAG TPA: protein of unknown function (DUF5401) [Caudoviricetes sp.]